MVCIIWNLSEKKCHVLLSYYDQLPVEYLHIAMLYKYKTIGTLCAIIYYTALHFPAISGIAGASFIWQ